MSRANSLCLNEVSLANLQRILNFYLLRNLASNELFSIELLVPNSYFI
ncbi:riboflavin synthase subunit alpha [Fusobacterium polymorphum]|uniref:Riboflavin synthase subunit alpha n=1 Tax=Fusobacterium nucleatum subsp. polymorphum TaxID=76857 RepID=A0A2C6AU64_FUSNP|nr:riboflavin synthase subunit alpha [Fusobacterium polymorphum]